MDNKQVNLQLPMATPSSIEAWSRFLQRDAQHNGGTASALLNSTTGGVVKVTADSTVTIVEHIEDPIEAAFERALWLTIPE